MGGVLAGGDYPLTGIWWSNPEVAEPERPAVIGDDGCIRTRRGLVGAVGAVATALHDHGVSGSDRVALVMSPGPDLAATLVGAMSVAVVAPLSPSGSAGVLADGLTRVRATKVLVDSDPPVELLQAAALAGIPLIPMDPFAAGASTVPLRPQPEPSDTALVLETSGTTGRPKLVPLSHGNVLSAASWVAQVLDLGPADRSLAVMPLYHSSGIISSLLAPLLSGGSVICLQSTAVGRFADLLTRLEPTWLSAVPTLLHAMLTELEQAGSVQAHTLRFLRTAGTPMPAALHARLEAFLGVPVVEGYGMTEAYSACSNRLDGQGPARRPGSVGPPAGLEVAVLGPQRQHLPAGAVGEVVLRGVSVTAGYENSDDSGWIQDTGGVPWFASGDEGFFDPEGRLVLNGRIKEMVNRGGKKVVPCRVDEALLSHPAVAAAVAFGVPHPTLGEDLIAAVVLAGGASADEEDLRGHVMERLAPHEVPSRVVLLDELPYNTGGKAQRARLAEHLADSLNSPDEPPVGEMETLVATAFAEVLQQRLPARDANFFGLGGDSLSGQRVITRLGRALNLHLSPRLLFAHPSPKSLAGQLDRLLDEALAEFKGDIDRRF